MNREIRTGKRKEKQEETQLMLQWASLRPMKRFWKREEKVEAEDGENRTITSRADN